MSTKERFLKERSEKLGAQNYQSRRLLEMYNNESVLKVASQNQLSQHARNHKVLNTEASPGKINYQQALEMSEVLKRVN